MVSLLHELLCVWGHPGRRRGHRSGRVRGEARPGVELVSTQINSIKCIFLIYRFLMHLSLLHGHWQHHVDGVGLRLSYI